MLELIVVIAIIAVLAALIVQAMVAARVTGHQAACLSNLRAIGSAIAAYAGEHDGQIPYGPKAPPFTSPSDLYPSTGAPTSLLSLRDGSPVGLGLLLDRYLEKTPQVLFCPGCDEAVDAAAELAKVGHSQAQGGYYYRHAGATSLFDPRGGPPPPEHIRLFDLGNNRRGLPIRALVVDALFDCPPDLAQFNVKPRRNHGGRIANVLFADGHARSFLNDDHSFTVDVRDPSALHASFDKILQVFEHADENP